jgi:hypothetical protein
MSALVVSLALLLIQIEGGATCPTAREVAARVAPLLRPSPAPASDHVATLAEELDGTLAITLTRPDGRTVTRRRLPRAASCAEQAEAAAVALAVWEAQINPEIALRLDGLPPGAAPAETSPPLRGQVANLHGVAPSVPTRTLLPAVGIAAIASRQAGSTAAGARADATLSVGGWRFRPRLSVAGSGQHTLSLGPGEARWSRLYAALGGDYVLPLGERWQAALGASATFGGVFVEAAGFSANGTSRSVDVGVEAMARLEVRLGAVRPWLGMAIAGWSRRRIVEVTNVGAAILPRIEPVVAVGADFCWRP